MNVLSCCRQFLVLSEHFGLDYKGRLVKGYPNGDVYEYKINYCPFCGKSLRAPSSNDLPQNTNNKTYDGRVIDGS